MNQYRVVLRRVVLEHLDVLADSEEEARMMETAIIASSVVDQEEVVSCYINDRSAREEEKAEQDAP